MTTFPRSALDPPNLNAVPQPFRIEIRDDAIKWRVDIFREYLRRCFRIGTMVLKS